MSLRLFKESAETKPYPLDWPTSSSAWGQPEIRDNGWAIRAVRVFREPEIPGHIVVSIGRGETIKFQVFSADLSAEQCADPTAHKPLYETVLFDMPEPMTPEHAADAIDVLAMGMSVRSAAHIARGLS